MNIRNNAKIKIIVYLFLLSNFAFSQTKDYPWAASFGVGILDYKGELGNGLFHFQVAPYTINSRYIKNRPGISVFTLSRFLNSHFDLAINGHWGEWGYFNKKTDAFFYRNSRYLDANLRWKFLANPPKHFQPFLLTGLGYRNLLATENTKTQHELVLPLGLGANIPFRQRWGLTLQSNAGLNTGDFGDANEGGSNDLFWNHTIALTYRFGKSAAQDGDEDKDGVNDSKDKCPNTKIGLLVDKDGCELDRDKDGISDGLDKCPDVFGLATLKGCPDKDLDGIADNDDACPELPGELSLKGCPDKDKDGIADKDDKCPEVPGPIDNLGCPRDKPTPEPIPPIPNPKPDPNPIPIQSDTILLENVRFNLNSAELTEETLLRLEKAVNFMKQNEGYYLLLTGHTDDLGSDQYNFKLSKQRSLEVRKYLISKGIPSSSIKTRGFGYKFPETPLQTNEARFKNRRVIIQAVKQK